MNSMDHLIEYMVQCCGVGTRAEARRLVAMSSVKIKIGRRVIAVPGALPPYSDKWSGGSS